MKFLNVKLRVSIEYSDIDYYCKSSAISVPFVFTIELDDNNKAIRGILKKDKYKSYSLEQKELENIQIISENNLAWIKSIKLSDGLLKLFAYNDSHLKSMCSPPEDLKDLNSNEALIDFGVSSIGYLLPQILNSNQIIVYGKNSKNESYQIKLSLTQIRL